jgi:hypothetical protein
MPENRRTKAISDCLTNKKMEARNPSLPFFSKGGEVFALPSTGSLA